ncbi:hypothetical protein P153DRAFT_340190 [Dothidotthia symphoricarpi CBS 119687]|uniref:Knr4/Smi1-like domain-containing protein n=1 Tax=Dothidotthia symphoricarpi CBS 119687 TaxID=1392245 RepID=A0A6A6AEG4_9PLEO|nr:uncharacterized protein P153DRAFT_340190 [Dothidotthia symphoricarpi CBS 119687]KAF2129388.1 hypothetical protein P153DRAFT_340190 [Dothidotthia symphoricarpi CBS 119687]
MPSAIPLIPWSKTVLLCTRDSKHSSVVVQQAALDLFVLGYPNHANKLIDALYEYGHGITFDLFVDKTMIALYNAWEATNTTPSYISNPDPDKVFNGRYNQEKSGDVREYVDTDWVKGLPEEWREKAVQGGLSKKELDIAIQRLNTDPQNREPNRSRTAVGAREDASNPDISMTLGAVVQVALLLDEEDIARDLVEKYVPNIYRHVQEKSASSTTLAEDIRKWLEAHLGLHHSPRIWHILKSAYIGQALNMDEEALEAFVSKGCANIKERFTHGPRRPYADLKISELVHLLTADTPEPVPIPNNSHQVCFISLPDEPSTYLQPPATPSQVAELESRLQGDSTEEYADAMQADEQLPEDYKAFLLTSNGFCAPGEGDNPGAIFFDIEGVANHDIQFLEDYEFELFSNALHSEDISDNILFGDIKGFTIGAGGDEGDIVLFSPTTVKPMLEAFEKVYATASDRERRAYERAAVSLYGGIEKLRGVEWLCTMNFHWAGEQDIWGSFREFLEYIVGYAVKTRWEHERKMKEEKGEKRKRGEGEAHNKSQDVGMRGDEDIAEDVVVKSATEHHEQGRYDLRDTKSRRTE